MGIVLALAAALAYGVSDFVGGLASRRTTPWPVALLAGVGALAGALALAVAVPGDATGPDVVWGGVAGVGSGAGGAFLYRGLAGGRMAVVAPVSAVGAALVPVLVGLVTGERPTVLVWVGIAVALPGIWLVARTPEDHRHERGPSGLLDGVLAGLGFGILFAAMGQVPESAGFAPLVACQAVALVAVVALATANRSTWLPTAATEWWGLAAGLLATGAVLSFLLATQTGLLTVASVLTSLYPAVTVLLAALVLREHIVRPQAVGLLLCAAAIGMVAAG